MAADSLVKAGGRHIPGFIDLPIAIEREIEDLTSDERRRIRQAPRRFVWNPTFTMAADRPVHMTAGRMLSERYRRSSSR